MQDVCRFGSMPEKPEPTLLAIVSGLVAEVGGARAAANVEPGSDLERDLGLGSLERVELFARIEEAFGVTVPDEAATARTPAELERFVESARGPRAAVDPKPLPRVARRSLRVGELTTFQHALLARADEDPDATHAIIRTGDGIERVLTRGGVAERALGFAAGLGTLEPHERIALMLPTSEDFLGAFLGILLAGGIPVPLYPPLRSDRIREFAERQRAIFANAGIRRLVLAEPALAPHFRQAIDPRLEVVAPLEDVVPARHVARGAPSDAAFIQYTSGSTGDPKGVLVDHRAALANVTAIGRLVEARADDVVVSWLPLYHDMGLVGSWLFALVHGIPIVLIPPASFLVRPERWLRAIHEHRGTLSAAPSFGYELAARRVKDETVAELDLGSWREALNGSEPVRPRTLEAFARRFAPAGFRRESLRPVYGLAESTVALAFPPSGRGPRVVAIERKAFETRGEAVATSSSGHDVLEQVAVGFALPDHEIRIVDDEGRELPPRREGRIVFRGPSRMVGYYGRDDATARITLALDGRDYLDTGDLGWRDESGELFVSGRRKDLVIQAGRNLDPAEIEDAAESVTGVRAAAVFGVDDAERGSERLVVVVETREREREPILDSVRSTIVDRVDAVPDEVVAVAPGAIPRTSSGKVRRAACREAWHRGELVGRVRVGVRAHRSCLRDRSVQAMGGILRAAARGLFALWFVATAGPTFLLAWLAIALLPRAATPFVARLYARLFLRLAFSSMVASGLERLRTPAILAVNHASYLDVVVLLAALPSGIRFLSKAEVLAWPFVGAFLRRGGHLSVTREDLEASRHAASEVERAVREGALVVVFPEATFTRASGVRPFKLGAFRAAAAAGCPIIPLGLAGTRRLLPAGRRVPRPTRVTLRAGSPIDPCGADWTDVLRLRDETRRAISELSGEPLLDLHVAGLAGVERSSS